MKADRPQLLATVPSPIEARVSLRPAVSGDDGFLFSVYKAIADDEFRLAIPDENQRAALLDVQYRIRQQQYGTVYGGADSQIILLDQSPVGRLLIHRQREAWTLVDIAILPAYQNQGIGSRVLDWTLREAASSNVPLRLHVRSASPARRLYERLGFVEIGNDGVHSAMERAPES
jgi:ribosomal protein S18 acetylase RimI-like enzyme